MNEKDDKIYVIVSENQKVVKVEFGEKIRPIDANAAIEKLRANFQQGSQDGCEDPLCQIAEDTIAEMPTIGFVDGFYPEATKQLMDILEKEKRSYIEFLSSHLTFDQLCKMDGKCVKVVVDGIEPLEMLALVEFVKNEDCVLLRNNLGGASEFYCDDDLREDHIKVYAYPSDQIDLEEWTAEWKEYTGSDAGFHYCSQCKQQAFNYEDGGEVVEVLSDFCPGCARAMKPEALSILEKRLRGEKKA